MEPVQVIIYFMGGVLAYALLILLTRWLLGLDGSYDRQTKTIKLLREIAKKQGVAEAEIKDILG